MVALQGRVADFEPLGLQLGFQRRELLAAAGVSTELWLVPGCRHVQAHNVDPEGYERRVLKFLATTLPE